MSSSKPLNNRRRLAALATAALITASLAACDDSEGTPRSSPAATSQPVSGGTLTYGIDQGLDNINPAVSGTDISPFIGRNIFDSLVFQADDGTFAPWLATSWKISPDGKTYTFKLEDGVTFHDGTPFDADSVKAFFEYVLDPDTKSISGTPLLAAFDRAKVIDPQTIEITLKTPYSQFLQALSTPTLGIQSPKAIATPAEHYQPIGTGPFKFVSWTPKVEVELEANETYTSPPEGAEHTGAPYLDDITFSFLNEDSTRYGALTSGQVDAINAVPPNSIKTLKSMSGYQVHSGLYPGLVYTVFLKQSGGILADENVRKALVESVDMDALVNSVYFDTATVAKSILSPTTPGYDPSTEGSALPYDPDDANSLLDAAGWTEKDDDGIRMKDGQRLTLQWPAYVPGVREQRDVLTQGIQADAMKVGIDLQRPQLTDISEFIGGYIDGTWDLLDLSQITGSADGLYRYFATASGISKGGSNLLSTAIPSLDEYLNEARAASEPVAASSAYNEAATMILKDALAMPTYVPGYNMGTSDKVQGVEFDAQGLPDFYDFWVAE